MNELISSLISTFPYAGAVLAIYLFFKDAIRTNGNVAKTTNEIISGMQVEIKRLHSGVTELELTVKSREEEINDLKGMIHQLRSDWHTESVENSKRMIATYEKLNERTEIALEKMAALEIIFNNDSETAENRLDRIEEGIMNFSVEISSMKSELKNILYKRKSRSEDVEFDL